MKSQKVSTVESIWSRLPAEEAASSQTLDPSVSAWEELIKSCVEAGSLAPMVPTKNPQDSRLVAAAPFLKCSLDDLRAIWTLTASGYTAQAAAVAAALFENALTAAVLAWSHKLVEQGKKTKFAEIPWGAKELCQLDAKRESELAEAAGKKTSQKEHLDNWTISYLHYKWLCQVKHPTWQSAMHAARSTMTSFNEFAVRPGPNRLEEDVQVKARVLAISVTKALQAIKSFFITLDGDPASPEYDAFETKVNKAHFGVIELIAKQYGKAQPIAVLDRSFIKTDFATLIEKYGK
jgi:hypothetical protein